MNDKTKEIIKTYWMKSKKITKQEIKERGTLILTLGMLITSTGMRSTSNKQANISKDQTKILSQQTEILEQQAEIQNNQLDFEKEKNWTDTAKDYRKTMNELYDNITYKDEILMLVHEKVLNNEDVINIDNLNRYVDGFENIGMLYCDGKIKLMDLRGILQDPIERVCGNMQINLHYKNHKSGVSALCKTLYPKSSGMAKFVNYDKCPILKK